MAQTLFLTIVGFVFFSFLLETWTDVLNAGTWKLQRPLKVSPFMDEETYDRAKRYNSSLAFTTLWSRFTETLVLLLILGFGGFSLADTFFRRFTDQPVLLALLFMGSLSLGSDLISLPFQIHRIFGIDERFGFNRRTPRTFLTDRLKGYLLGVLLGAPLLALLVVTFQWLGTFAWLYAWALLAVVMLFLNLFYTSLIVPLFNKLTPLEESPLRKSIEAYCSSVEFPLENIYVMDGSRRSTRANAFFSGLGSRKKIVLYDTLIEKHSVEELTAVLAHEVGHYKKKHVIQGLVVSLLETGGMLFLFSWFVFDPELSRSLGGAQPSFHMGMTAFSLLFTPLSLILRLLGGLVSRKNEYQADAFAARTYGAKPLRSALLGLSVDHLSNLHPHPVYVMFHYSHPPVLNRIEHLEKEGQVA